MRRGSVGLGERSSAGEGRIDRRVFERTNVRVIGASLAAHTSLPRLEGARSLLDAKRKRTWVVETKRRARGKPSAREWKEARRHHTCEEASDEPKERKGRRTLAERVRVSVRWKHAVDGLRNPAALSAQLAQQLPPGRQ